MKWLVTPYSFLPNLTALEKKFNKALSSARVTSERAFGILKESIMPMLAEQFRLPD